MCSLELPKAVIKQLDKFRKNCLWQGAEMNARKPPKAAWKMVYAAKKRWTIVCHRYQKTK
jgi:hypothetical protein